MSLVHRYEHLKIGQNEKNSNRGFYDVFRGSALLRVVVFCGGSIALLLCASLALAQQGTTPQGRNQPKPNGSFPQQTPHGDSKRMELEERRHLRQEIQRHGPDFRSKEVGARPMPNALAAPALPPAAGVLLPSAPQSAALPPLPSYFGSPVLPASNPSPGISAVPTSGISRGPALSQEERQQLRQQIRDERKRGLYPTPTEVDR
jgi:hypothetical protein